MVEVRLLFAHARVVGNANGKRVVFALDERFNHKEVGTPAKHVAVFGASPRFGQGQKIERLEQIRLTACIVCPDGRLFGIKSELGLFETSEIRQLERRNMQRDSPLIVKSKRHEEAEVIFTFELLTGTNDAGRYGTVEFKHHFI